MIVNVITGSARELATLSPEEEAEAQRFRLPGILSS
jgi:hypothetical protein